MFRTYARLLIVFFILVFGFTIASCASSNQPLQQDASQLPYSDPSASDIIDSDPSDSDNAESESVLPEAHSEPVETTIDDDFSNCDSDEPSDSEITAEHLDPSFFDDAVFFGDSVSAVLQYNALNENSLGNAQFYPQTGYSINAAANGLQLLRYRGHQMTPQNILRTVGAKKVFIMLGLNDPINPASIDKTMSNWTKLVSNIREYVPDIRIYIQSCTPMYYDRQKDNKNNNLIDKYNDRLREFCIENDCTYVSIGEHFKDENGNLIEEFTRDKWIHLNFAGAAFWAELLKDPSNYSIPPV